MSHFYLQENYVQKLNDPANSRLFIINDPNVVPGVKSVPLQSLLVVQFGYYGDRAGASGSYMS